MYEDLNLSVHESNSFKLKKNLKLFCSKTSTSLCFFTELMFHLIIVIALQRFKASVPLFDRFMR